MWTALVPSSSDYSSVAVWALDCDQLISDDCSRKEERHDCRCYSYSPSHLSWYPVEAHRSLQGLTGVGRIRLMMHELATYPFRMKELPCNVCLRSPTRPDRGNAVAVAHYLAACVCSDSLVVVSRLKDHLWAVTHLNLPSVEMISSESHRQSSQADFE